MAYDNTNRGAIWPNTKMRPDKQDPHFTGNLNVNGQEFYVNAWKKGPDAKNEAPSLSFSIKPKEEQNHQAPTRQDQYAAEPDDEFPF